MTINIGDKAPGFLASTDGNRTISLKDLRGKKVVQYFYPKDMTPSCTTEACGFRDAHPEFFKINAEIIGVSKDTVKKHDKFKEKCELPFALASDEDGEVCEAYGVWQEKKNYGRTYMGISRSTFLIDEKGDVRKIWRKVRVTDHVEAVLTAVEEL